ncbi:NADH dehydrogenase [ubiquinone] flavoprotein 3, mitochondrial isoform X4 [Channa argus]|uniref:NADH dehydrogenase [ubiquinone] flavoprotein 3, mitochondrial isoform X4 n=1 Tax=Channa argus TaxID=215402 RepID=UPI003523026D
MATFLLRSGRLCPIKYHQLESWGILRNQSVALLCTQPGEPAKPGKKTKAASKKAAASAPAEPEESFDNSTYKNYQHHSYTPFTFVDLEVEMAKFRLPQPSSGRPSPRH